MRVLLINSNLRDDLFAAPPVGVCYVAAATEAAGHDVRVVDLCFRKRPLAVLERAIRTYSPEVTGVSVRNIDNVNMLYPVSYLADAEQITRKIREVTDAPLVLGGSGASLLPAPVLRRLNGDYIVVNHGERTFTRLLKALEDGASPEGIPGVGYMENGRFRLKPSRKHNFGDTWSDLGRWIDMTPYRRRNSSYSIQTRRGCSQRCIYCTYGQILEGYKIHKRSPVDVADEIEEAIGKHGLESFEFVDSVFNDPLDHCVEILEEIVRRPWKARLTAMGVSPKGLNDELLGLMKRAGFNSFWMSPESASPRMIENYGKGFTVDDLVHAAEATGRTDFTITWCFLIGGPGETNATFQESLDFTLKYIRKEKHPPVNLANFYFGVRVYPETKLWSLALEEGFFGEDSDPLQQLWYLSEKLDLDVALDQFKNAMQGTPEISCGYHEMLSGLWRTAAFIGDRLLPSQPYWPNLVFVSELFYKLGLHRVFPMINVPKLLRRQLRLQGYRGRHLEAAPRIASRLTWNRSAPYGRQR